MLKTCCQGFGFIAPDDSNFGDLFVHVSEPRPRVNQSGPWPSDTGLLDAELWSQLDGSRRWQSIGELLREDRCLLGLGFFLLRYVVYNS